MEMKSKQSIVFDKIHQSYYPTIIECNFVGTSYYFLETRQNASEEHHLIANAANKYWELIDV